MRAHSVWHCFYTSAIRLSVAQNRHRRRTFHMEPLEQRALLAADLRSFTGEDNNLQNPDWGSTDVQLLRTVAADYGDGISSPAGDNRESARELSNVLAAQTVENLLNSRNLSAMVYAWGQFVDHDIDLTDAALDPPEAFPIEVPSGDIYFDPQGTGTATIDLYRSAFDPATGNSADNPRQQLNRITAFIDGSQIYGSSDERAAALRTFSDGHLKVSDGNLLPYNTDGWANDNPTGEPSESLFLAGDVRANENIELTSLHTLFVREHNRIADQLAERHPDWTDEQLFQQARRLVIGEIQAITYKEFLPALLGDRALSPYRGYDPTVNPGIANEFSTAAFRLGHSMLGNDIEFLDNNADEVHDAVALRDAFFNPSLLADTGIDSILKYLASDPSQEIDTHVVDEVRNFLFGDPGFGGFDLASLNIQRGRDHGLADYNATRVAYGLSPVSSFADITSNQDLQAALSAAYNGDVNNIDLWVGGLAEDHMPGSSVGPLFQRILTDQFERLRDGDRFWYERDLSGSDLRRIQNTTLADVIRMNTTTTNLQDNVFEYFNSISGRVFADGDGNGRIGRGERGLAGIKVELLDQDGNRVASAITAQDGTYTFDDLELAVYEVRVQAPRNTRLTTRGARMVDLTRAEEVSKVDFGVDSGARPRRQRQRNTLQDMAVNQVSSEMTLLDPLPNRGRRR